MNEKDGGGATKLFKQQNERINTKGKEPGLLAVVWCDSGLKRPYQQKKYPSKILLLSILIKSYINRRNNRKDPLRTEQHEICRIKGI